MNKQMHSLNLFRFFLLKMIQTQLRASCFILISLVFALSSCSFKSESLKPEISKISISSIQNSNLDSQAKAEELAKAAELLLNAEGFDQALEISQQALKLDANNLRAQFVEIYSKVKLLMKGLLIRLKPIAEKNLELAQAFKESKEKFESEEGQDPKVLKFANDGKPDIVTESDLQNYLDQATQVYNELRIFAKKNLDKELVVKNNGNIVSNLNKRYVDSCEIKTTEKGEFEIICPPNSFRFYLTLNRGDFEALQMMASVALIDLSFFTAYDFSGAIEGMKNFPLNEREQQAQEIYNNLFQNEKLGLLRNPKAFQIVKSLGREIILSLRWVMANQKSLCPNGGWGDNTFKNRPGTVIPEGLCFDPFYFKPYVDSLEPIFSGKPSPQLVSHSGRSYKAQVNIMALFDQPVTDLRNLGPVKFNRCSQIYEVGDLTMGGSFPNGDANEYLRVSASRCE